MTALLEPRLQCRRMFLGLPAKLEQLSIVKAWTGSVSLKRLFRAHVRSLLDIYKKNKKKLDNFHSSANLSYDKKMAVEHILD